MDLLTSLIEIQGESQSMKIELGKGKLQFDFIDSWI